MIFIHVQNSIFSQTDDVSTSWVGETLIDHVARVRDVELITGYSFMTSWSRGGDDERQERTNKLLDLPQFDADWFTVTSYTRESGDVTVRASLWSLAAALVVALFV